MNNIIAYTVIGVFSFILIGTLVPSLVSTADSFTVLVGFGLGAVFAGLMFWSVFQLIKIILDLDDED